MDWGLVGRTSGRTPENMSSRARVVQEYAELAESNYHGIDKLLPYYPTNRPIPPFAQEDEEALRNLMSRHGSYPDRDETAEMKEWLRKNLSSVYDAYGLVGLELAAKFRLMFDSQSAYRAIVKDLSQFSLDFLTLYYRVIGGEPTKLYSPSVNEYTFATCAKFNDIEEWPLLGPYKQVLGWEGHDEGVLQACPKLVGTLELPFGNDYKLIFLCYAGNMVRKRLVDKLARLYAVDEQFRRDVKLCRTPFDVMNTRLISKAVLRIRGEEAYKDRQKLERARQLLKEEPPNGYAVERDSNL